MQYLQPDNTNKILDFRHSTSLWSLSHWQFWKHCWRYRLSSKQFLESESMGASHSLDMIPPRAWLLDSVDIPILFCGLSASLFLRTYAEHLKRKSWSKDAEVEIPISG